MYVNTYVLGVREENKDDYIRIAEVFAWEEGTVLKLGREKFPSDWIEYEYKIAQIVHETGINTPKPMEHIQINGRYGIVYERVDGPTMLDKIAVFWPVISIVVELC